MPAVSTDSPWRMPRRGGNVFIHTPFCYFYSEILKYLCVPSCRAKLADWLASKGKTFKRPAAAAAETSKTRGPAKANVDLNPQARPAARRQPEARLEACKPESEGASLETQSQTAPAIMNITLDLLENSDVDPQDSVDDVRRPAVFRCFNKDITRWLTMFFPLCPSDRSW